MSKTNLGLVKYAESKLKLPTIYMLGGIGRKLTAAMVNARIAKGDRHTKANELTIRAGIGKYCFDCNALMKCYLWETSPGVINYKAESDLGSTTLYNRATEKGKIETMPDIKGLLVWTADLGHVGIYVGKKNGVNQYIEATPAWNAWGVTTSADKNHSEGHNRKWAFWGKYHLIEYIEEKPPVVNYHKVVKGEVLSTIAPKYKITWQQLYELNKNVILKGPNVIEIGMELRLNKDVKEIPYYKEEPKPAPKPEPTPPTTVAGYKVGDIVTWSGYIYRDSYGKGRQASYPERPGTIKIVNKNPYGIHIDNLGWIAPAQIKGHINYAPPVDPKVLKVGDKVKVTGKKYATGQTIPAWVKLKTYTIQETYQDRVLIKEIKSWVYKLDVKKV